MVLQNPSLSLSLSSPLESLYLHKGLDTTHHFQSGSNSNYNNIKHSRTKTVNETVILFLGTGYPDDSVYKRKPRRFQDLSLVGDPERRRRRRRSLLSLQATER